jgi:hypothetical protein
VTDLQLAKVAVAEPAADDGVHWCKLCGDHYQLEDGLEASAFCHPCAHTAATQLAKAFLKLHARRAA